MVDGVGVKEQFQCIVNKGSNLEIGSGVRWAGHDSAILELRVSVMDVESSLLANLGFVDPIGSNK